MFRLLNVDEIDVRVSTISDKGCSLLLYKDARVDMNILDEEEHGKLGNWQSTRLSTGNRGQFFASLRSYGRATIKKCWVETGR